MIYEVKTTVEFSKWLKKLKDIQGKIAIARRVERIQNSGNFGDFKAIDTKLYELRVKVGPGYRVYYTKKGKKVIILLIGGDKSTQSKDIQKAKILMKEYL